MAKLSFEKWKEKYVLPLEEELVTNLKTLFGINADEEVDRILVADYNRYITNGDDRDAK